MDSAQTNQPFGRALHDLLQDRDEYLTQTGNVNWHAFARALTGVHYESLRKAVAGERGVTAPIVEEVARVLQVRPTYFAEYRLHQLRDSFDVRVVGFEQALRNYQDWADGRAPTRP